MCPFKTVIGFDICIQLQIWCINTVQLFQWSVELFFLEHEWILSFRADQESTDNSFILSINWSNVKNNVWKVYSCIDGQPWKNHFDWNSVDALVHMCDGSVPIVQWWVICVWTLSKRGDQISLSGTSEQISIPEGSANIAAWSTLTVGVGANNIKRNARLCL